MKQLFRYIISTLFCCLTFIFFAQAQNPWIDSLKKASLIEKADTNRINALLSLCNAYRFSYPDSSLAWAQQALVFSQKINNDTLIFWSYVAIGTSLHPLGNFSAELDNAYKLLPVAKRLNTSYARGYSNGLMSDAYMNFGEYKISLNYWRKVIALVEHEMPSELASIYGNSAYLFARAIQYDSALIYGRKAYSELYKNDNLKDSSTIQFISSNISIAIGEAFAGKPLYDSALYHFHISLYNAEKVDLRFNKIDACNGIAAIYKKQAYNDSAIFYLQKIFAIDGAAKRYPIGILKAATLLAALYEAKQQPDSSLKYMHIASDIKDSVYSRDKTSAFQNIIFQQKEKENEVAKVTEKLKNQYQLYFLIVAFIVLIIIAAIVIRNRRLKQLQDIRNNIADDLHDDLGSTLSSINIMSELAKVKSPEASPLLTSISESTSAMQENMSDIVWAVNPQNDVFENVLQRMNLFASEILEAKNMDLEFISDESLSTYKFTMKQRKNLYLFFKEAINNAAKYSCAKKISVRISKKNNHIEMNITDNGKGFDTTGVFNGNGMNTFKKRAQELNADFTITSHINEGTTAQLKFKIT